MKIKIDYNQCNNAIECKKCLEYCPAGVFMIYPKGNHKTLDPNLGDHSLVDVDEFKKLEICTKYLKKNLTTISSMLTDLTSLVKQLVVVNPPNMVPVAMDVPSTSKAIPSNISPILSKISFVLDTSSLKNLKPPMYKGEEKDCK